MRHSMILGLCILAAACESAGSRPTAPSTSAITATQTQHSARPVEVTFTKWVTAFPAMAGFTGGDVPGVRVLATNDRQHSLLRQSAGSICHQRSLSSSTYLFLANSFTNVDSPRNDSA